MKPKTGPRSLVVTFLVGLAVAALGAACYAPVAPPATAQPPTVPISIDATATALPARTGTPTAGRQAETSAQRKVKLTVPTIT